MKKRPTLKNILVLCILTCCTLLFSFTDKEELQKYLEEYNNILKDQKRARVFKFSDGYPKVGFPILTDQNGMKWYGLYEPRTIFSFTGTNFIDVLATNKIAQNDNIGIDIQTKDKTPYIMGEQHIYKWNGYKLLAYKFPEKDKIRLLHAADDNSVYCYGVKGYAVLKNNFLYYYPYQGFTYPESTSEIQDIFLSQAKILLSLQINPQNPNLLHFYTIKGNKQLHTSIGIDSSAVSKKYTIQYYYKELNENQVCIYSQFSNDVYILNTKLNTVEKIELEPDFGVDYAIYENSTLEFIAHNTRGEMWTTKVYSYNLSNKTRIILTSFTYPKPIVSYTIQFIFYVWKSKLYLFLNPHETYTYGFLTMAANNNNFSFYNLDNSKIETLYYPGKIIRVYDDEDNLIVCYEHPSFPDITVYIVYNYKTNIGLQEELKLNLFKVEVWQYLFAVRDSTTISYISDEGLTSYPINKGTSQIFKFISDLPKEDTKNQYKYWTQNKIYYFGSDIVLISCYFKQNKPMLSVSYLQEGGIENICELALKGENIHTYYSYIADPVRGRIYFLQDNKWHYLELATKKIVSTNYSADYRPLSNEITIPLMTDYKSKNIISLTNNSEYKGKIDISFIADKLSIKIPDFIKKKEYMNWVLPHKSVLDTEKEIIYFNANREFYLNDFNYWTYGNYTPDVLNTLIFKQNSFKEQEFLYPCISLNLRSGEVKLHPHWLQVFRDAENRLYALDKDIPGPKGRVFIRQIINGEAISSKDDPELSYSELVKNYLEVTQLNNNLLLQIGNTLYYLEEGKWQKLLVANLEQYGELQNGVKINGNIYLGCESRVVKVLPDGSTFVFGESEGIPEGALSLYKVGQKIIIKNETGLYEFLEAGKNVKTVLAGFWAGEQLVSASIPQKFSYKTHSVRFPVYILNTLYPEKCFLEYQLQGYNDLPVRIPFAEEIRFDNLKPGAYSFSYTVITETGQRVKSPVVAFTIKHPLYATGWAYAVYVIAFLSALWGIYKLRTRQLKLRNLDLEKTVAERTQELKERQQRLQESIEYASLIQKSILPQKTDLQQHFPNQFVLWRPRDIVGGDFYWLYAPDSFCTYFALIDCTGHGVPGALLSMTVNSLLDNLVKDRQLNNPAEILANLHLEISTTLHQRSEQAQQDGVEIALLKIEAANKLLTFCGAGLNLVHYLPDKDEFHFQRGDKHSLGGAKWFETLQFENHKIIYNAGDRIYLYTDGIIDQPALNSEPPKRLGTQPWLDYLQSIANKPFAEQLDLLHLFVNELITFHEQRDDITVIGIEPP